MANPTFDVARGRQQAGRFTLPAWLALICIVTFTVLISAGAAIYKNAPPIPATVVSPQQEIIFTQATIQSGQATYLARGGQHIGSIWGHGSYLAPDWTADVLHRWGLSTVGVLYSGQTDFAQADWQALSESDRALLQVKLRHEFKTNRYDADTGQLTLTAAQAQGLKQVFADYYQLLSQGSAVHSIPSGWFTDDTQIRNVTAFLPGPLGRPLLIVPMRPFPIPRTGPMMSCLATRRRHSF